LTPFDKFPLPARDTFMPGIQTPGPSKYAYFGLRDHTNRASITALLYRSVERLSEASKSSAERRNQVAGVFGFLGYQPKIRLVYRFRVSLTDFHQRQFGDGLRTGTEAGFVHRRVTEALEAGKLSQKDLLAAVDLALEYQSRPRELELILDFDGQSDRNNLFEAAHLLRSFGLISIRSVEIERHDGAHFNLRDASSGELSIVTGFLALATTLEESSLILIDEPEISLHPAWQNRYIDLLLSTFSSYVGCHYLVATHSPLILSDSSIVASKVIYLDLEPGLDAAALAGQSPDYLLVNAFRVPGRNNYYLKQELVSVLRLVADDQTTTPEFEEKMRMLTPLLAHLDTNDPVHDVISQLQRLRMGTEGAV
jgi:hypothetical protein